MVDELKAAGKLNCLKVLHYHQGSQIPNISVIREGLTEACRMYIDLVREGAPMGTLDMGGGLAVDYDGSQTNFHSSCNYSVEEYARDIVEIVGEMCTKCEVPHPTLVTESGRAISAYHSVLVFNILDVTTAPGMDAQPTTLPENASEILKALDETRRMLRLLNETDVLRLLDAVSWKTVGDSLAFRAADGRTVFLVSRTARAPRRANLAPDGVAP